MIWLPAHMQSCPWRGGSLPAVGRRDGISQGSSQGKQRTTSPSQNPITVLRSVGRLSAGVFVNSAAAVVILGACIGSYACARRTSVKEMISNVKDRFKKEEEAPVKKGDSVNEVSLA